MSSWDRIEVREAHIGQAFRAGLIGTMVVTVLMYAASALGMPILKMPDVIARVFTFNEPFIAAGSTLWYWGLVLYLNFGIIVIPAVYAYWVYGCLSGSARVRGLTFGACLWLLVQIWFMPLRSEEHTSELQSHVNLVCRLLLE